MIKMKPNLVIIIIDSLRADKCFGDKSLLTNNLSSIIKKGVYCNQTITSIPATIGSLGGIFTGEYSFKTKINTFQYHSKIKSYFEILKNSNYNLYATTPNMDCFNKWGQNFNQRDMTELFGSLENGIGETIIKKLKSKEMKEPWTYYIHLMDLHADAKGKFRIPEKFKNEKYGNNDYDRAIFFTDYWLGKIFENINFENTLVVITADHGHSGKMYSERNIVEKIISKGKILGPRFFKFGINILNLFKRVSGEYQEFFKLPDTLLKIPLIFVGYGIKEHKIINQLVRNIDIFPTIADIMGLVKQEEINGVSILPLFHNKKLDESPVYIESKMVNLDMANTVIGLRNSNYKYYRNRQDVNSKINLYDLINDPDEINGDKTPNRNTKTAVAIELSLAVLNMLIP